MSTNNQPALDLFSNYSDLMLTDEELLAIHGGDSPSSSGGATASSVPGDLVGYTGSTGLGIPAAQEILNQQILAAARPVVQALETGVYYARQAAAEAIRFATDPIGHTGEVIADQVEPDGPPPHSSK